MTDAIAPSLRPLAEGQRPGGPFPTRMTALPQQRTSPSLSSLVRFVPRTDICSAANSTLFDYLVGAGDQRLGVDGRWLKTK